MSLGQQARILFFKSISRKIIRAVLLHPHATQDKMTGQLFSGRTTKALFAGLGKPGKCAAAQPSKTNVGRDNKFSNTSASAANGQLTATCMMTARHNLTYLLRAFEVRGDQEACRRAAKSKLCPRLDLREQ
jgi:hypothetical protein